MDDEKAWNLNQIILLVEKQKNALKIAKSKPLSEVIGIDLSKDMLNYLMGDKYLHYKTTVQYPLIRGDIIYHV